MGRVSLNPFVHIDLIGLLFLIFFRVGWGKPVIMDPRNFKYPKLYELIASLSGPFSNFLLALISLYIIKYFIISNLATVFFSSIVYMNVMLGLFNILPIPPLDGGHIISIFIPKDKMRTFQRIQLFFILILVFIFFMPATQKLFVNTINNTINFLNTLVI
jgi:Zn-dependent protease